MKSTRSWKWLVPRFISRYQRKAASPTKAAARRCLVVEPLENRNLLAVASPHGAITVEQPPPVGEQGGQVVVTLLTEGLKVTTDEIQLLKALGSPPSTEAKANVADITIKKQLDKASVSLFQLNDTLDKLGQFAIKGQLTDKKFMAAEQKIEYLKIKLEDLIISSLDSNQQPAATDDLNELFKHAHACANGVHILKAEVSARKAGKDQLEYFKLAANILKLEDLALKVEVNTIENKSTGATPTEQISLNFSKIKVEYAKTKLGQNADAVAALNEFKTTLFPNLSGGGNFTGGISVPPSDDTIT